MDSGWGHQVQCTPSPQSAQNTWQVRQAEAYLYGQQCPFLHISWIFAVQPLRQMWELSYFWRTCQADCDAVWRLLCRCLVGRNLLFRQPKIVPLSPSLAIQPKFHRTTCSVFVWKTGSAKQLHSNGRSLFLANSGQVTPGVWASCSTQGKAIQPRYSISKPFYFQFTRCQVQNCWFKKRLKQENRVRFVTESVKLKRKPKSKG